MKPLVQGLVLKSIIVPNGRELLKPLVQGLVLKLQLEGLVLKSFLMLPRLNGKIKMFKRRSGHFLELFTNQCAHPFPLSHLRVRVGRDLH